MKVITRSEADTMNDRAIWPHPVPQWTGPDGTPRGVRLRALSLRDVMEARRAATNDKGELDQHRLMIEELRRGIYDPPDVPADVIMSWNADVVVTMYETLQLISSWNPITVERELDRLTKEMADATG